MLQRMRHGERRGEETTDESKKWEGGGGGSGEHVSSPLENNHKRIFRNRTKVLSSKERCGVEERRMG